MKKPEVNYREFRFSKLNSSRFRHLKLLYGWIFYFIFYALTELFVQAEKCRVIHSVLDDKIPFCEYFVIPYVLWYLMIVITLVYFALYSVRSFKRFMTFIIVTQVVAMAIYIFFPNRQDLRPTEFERDNIFTQMVNLLYTVDTNTNVCPSLHVGYSIGIASAWIKDKTVGVGVKVGVTVFCILVCLSTVFIKQHSVVDVFVALPMCLLAEIIAFGKKYWYPHFKEKVKIF